MADDRFFHNAGPITLQQLAALTGAVIATRSNAAPDGNQSFSGVAPLDRAAMQDISFLDNVKYLDSFASSKAGACFVRPKYAERAPKDMVLLVTEEPYTAYALTAQRFYPEPKITPGISQNANIAKSASIGKDVRIEAGVFIGEQAKIGDNCSIGANAVINDGVEIGSGSRIGSLVAISHATIGKRVIIHPGAKIGQDGFGFAPSKTGIVKVPQLGRVVIGDDVEIGANSCVDRGAGPDTIIGDHTKIDNLVQIGHNVKLGKYVIITGQCGVSGSTEIGDGAMLGAQSGLAGHLKIGTGAKLAARAGVMRDVPAGETHAGTPAVPIKDWHRQTAVLTKLIRKKEVTEE